MNSPTAEEILNEKMYLFLRSWRGRDVTFDLLTGWGIFHRFKLEPGQVWEVLHRLAEAKLIEIDRSDVHAARIRVMPRKK